MAENDADLVQLVEYLIAMGEISSYKVLYGNLTTPESTIFVKYEKNKAPDRSLYVSTKIHYNYMESSTALKELAAFHILRARENF